MRTGQHDAELRESTAEAVAPPEQGEHLEPTGVILEAAAATASTGRRVRLQLISEGFGNSADNHYYSRELLQKIAPRFKGVKMNSDHLTREAEQKLGGLPRSWRDVIGRITESYFALNAQGKGAIFAEAEVFDDQLWSLLKQAKDVIGVSVNARGLSQPVMREGRQANDVQDMTNIKSVDWVSEPGARGGVEELLEAAILESQAQQDAADEAAEDPGAAEATEDEQLEADRDETPEDGGDPGAESSEAPEASGQTNTDHEDQAMREASANEIDAATERERPSDKARAAMATGAYRAPASGDWEGRFHLTPAQVKGTEAGDSTRKKAWTRAELSNFLASGGTMMEAAEVEADEDDLEPDTADEQLAEAAADTEGEDRQDDERDDEQIDEDLAEAMADLDLDEEHADAFEQLVETRTREAIAERLPNALRAAMTEVRSFYEAAMVTKTEELQAEHDRALAQRDQRDSARILIEADEDLPEASKARLRRDFHDAYYDGENADEQLEEAVRTAITEKHEELREAATQHGRPTGAARVTGTGTTDSARINEASRGAARTAKPAERADAALDAELGITPTVPTPKTPDSEEPQR